KEIVAPSVDVNVPWPTMWLTPATKSGVAHSRASSVALPPRWVPLVGVAVAVTTAPPGHSGSSGKKPTGPLAVTLKFGGPCRSPAASAASPHARDETRAT